MNSPSKEQLLQILSFIPDPEIPIVNIQELGVLKDVRWVGEECVVDITPTYSGCPAMKQIEEDVRAELKKAGIENVKVNLIYSPAWTTDWITDEAKEKLRKYGIAPPGKTTLDKGVIMGKEKKIKCPHCNSLNTEMISQFGSTACKALWRCNDCKEPFDYFKCI